MKVCSVCVFEKAPTGWLASLEEEITLHTSQNWPHTCLQTFRFVAVHEVSSDSCFESGPQGRRLREPGQCKFMGPVNASPNIANQTNAFVSFALKHVMGDASQSDVTQRVCGMLKIYANYLTCSFNHFIIPTSQPWLREWSPTNQLVYRQFIGLCA